MSCMRCPGRVRLRVDKVKGNPAFAQKAQNKLGRVPGIKRVEAKPLTGSVLIYYDAAARLAEGALAEYAALVHDLYNPRLLHNFG